MLIEGCSAVYEADLKDPEGAAVPFTDLTAVSLTWYDPDRSDEKINSRDDQDILNNNNVTIDSNGHLRWELQQADVIILDNTKRFERRIGLFEYRWGANKRHFHEWRVTIKNLHLVT